MKEQAARCVVVATDLSETSPALIAVGDDAARKFGAELIVLHVFDPEGYEKIFGETGTLDQFAGYLRTELYEQVQAAGVETPVRLEIVEGRRVAREITATAARLNAVLIVIGARRRQGLRRALLGGVAGEVLRLARTPVLVAPTSVLSTVSLEAVS